MFQLWCLLLWYTKVFCAFTSCFHHNHMLSKDRFFYLKMLTWAKKLWNCMFVKIFQVSAIEEMGLFCINFSGWWTSFCYTSFAVLINIACLFKIIIASELRAEGLVYLPTLLLQLVANTFFFCSIPCVVLMNIARIFQVMSNNAWKLVSYPLMRKLRELNFKDISYSQEI